MSYFREAMRQDIEFPEGRIGILISGRGSNMMALIDACQKQSLQAEVGLVISNIESAPGLGKARDREIETLFISHKGRTREDHDLEMVEAFRQRGVNLVCLAGYMRLVSAELISAYKDRVLNIHPSLLPAFPGLDAQRQALEYGAKISGCTVHLVDEQLDHGPIILQRPVEVLEDDTVETLSARILEQEHIAYPEAVAQVLSPGFRVEGRRTRLFLTG
jgi:phosphoribosylglycinamide formyltransferase-1